MSTTQLRVLIATRKGWLSLWAAQPSKAPSASILESVQLELQWLERRLEREGQP